MALHNDLGKRGEQEAVIFLQNNGYTILEKNYRYLKAEVDIICIKNNILVAVEVKTRSTAYFGSPEEFVSPKKIQLMVGAIDYYVTHKDIDVEVRFDIIAIIQKGNSFQIKHIEDAFLHF